MTGPGKDVWCRMGATSTPSVPVIWKEATRGLAFSAYSSLANTSTLNYWRPIARLPRRAEVSASGSSLSRIILSTCPSVSRYLPARRPRRLSLKPPETYPSVFSGAVLHLVLSGQPPFELFRWPCRTDTDRTGNRILSVQGAWGPLRTSTEPTSRNGTRYWRARPW